MKNFIDKIMESKYIGNIALIIVAIILIIAGYLIYVQYQDNKDVSIYGEDIVDVYNVEIYDNASDKEKAESEKVESPKEEVKEEVKEEIKIEKPVVSNSSFPETISVFTKGKEVGSAIGNDKTSNFESIKNVLNGFEKLAITTDTVVSLDISSFADEVKKEIKNINAVIYNENGEIIFNSAVGVMYDRITMAVDELKESSIYYATATITLNDGSAIEYLLKF